MEIMMKCPSCGHTESKVIDSRSTEEGRSIKRRRECLACQRRFTTDEAIEDVPLIVIKKDESRESFDRNKVMNGIIRACEKRPVSIDTITKIVNDLEADLQNSLNTEVSSSYIGGYIMDRLKDIDAVSYVRFASVYREFKDVETFMHELESILHSKNSKKQE